MITFGPLGAETRIIVPDAVGPVVRGRVRQFLLENGRGYAATSGEEYRPGAAAKPEPVTIYDVSGLSSTALEELVSIVFAASETVALYVRLPNGAAGRFRRAEIEARST